jgi:hypothetical protein
MSTLGVAMTPGAMATQRTPKRPYWVAMYLVSPNRAAFELP